MAKMTKKKHSTGSGFTNKQRLKSPFSSISNMKMKSSLKKLSKKPLVKASKSAKKSREVVALEQQVKLMQEKLVKIERNQRRLQSSVEQSLEKSDKVKGRGQSTSGELEDEASRPSTSRLSTTKRKRKSDNVEDHSGKFNQLFHVFVIFLQKEGNIALNLFVFILDLIEICFLLDLNLTTSSKLVIFLCRNSRT